jgi:hypothetical protein
MYIFGGIFELTHELNDLVCFDFRTLKFSSNSETATVDDQSHMAAPEQSQTETASPIKRKTT